jgi:Fur family ferric uptake transcriptional regulator
MSRQRHDHATNGGWAEQARAALKEAGYSRGGARETVIAFLAGQSCATSAQDIHRALREQGHGVGTASVYRALETLHDLGLLQRLDMGHGESLFEPVHASGEHHHHIVCDRCERILPFEDRALERAITQLSRRVEFDVQGHDVVLHGRCPECGPEDSAHGPRPRAPAPPRDRGD